MNLILQGKPKKQIIVYSTTPRKVGEEVRVFDNGEIVQTGKIVKDLSTVSKYKDGKKRLNGEDVILLAQMGEKVRQRGARLVLDLAGVRSIDEKGLALLASWAGPQLGLRRPSLFLGQVLAHRGLAWEEGPKETR